ncbi:hypothetical protein [Clostridium cibarium]|uniref:Uncharacterized protein n=1 Tax=Clostridium cibarium TaxID=2762247 RepID=A0ABR8PNH1_9CLOT|nr:hypothetical protein [Clostridium cibarium]MBD7909733.1 hypothetical protein [Clostridium cibarium]
MNKFLNELVNRLNNKLSDAITNGCETDQWIENQLKFNKYITYSDGKFRVKLEYYTNSIEKLYQVNTNSIPFWYQDSAKVVYS